MTQALQPQDKDGWDGILDADERIIWQGRPDSALHFTPGMIGGAAFGLFFAGFALVWMLAAATAGGYFWMFGLIHFFVGLSLLCGTVFGPSFFRRHTWYTLTNQRAFIAKDLPVVGRSLKSYPITADTTLELKDGSLPSITFATERRRHRKGTRMAEVGFERIADGRDVFKLMRGIQKDQI